MIKKTRLTTLVAALMLGLAGLSGCQTPSGLARVTAGDGQQEPLGKRLGDLLDSQCMIPVKPEEDLRVHRQLRLIRAEWFLAVATRFGAARIPEHSRDPATDAALLHNQILKTMRYLREAEVEVGQDPNLYELSRSDLVLAILRTGYFAIEPAVQGVGDGVVSFIARPDAEKALKAAARLFQDRLYADAYRLTCEEHMAWVVKQRDGAATEVGRSQALADALKAVKGRVEGHFRQQCGRVAELAGVGGECAWPVME